MRATRAPCACRLGRPGLRLVVSNTVVSGVTELADGRTNCHGVQRSWERRPRYKVETQEVPAEACPTGGTPKRRVSARRDDGSIATRVLSPLARSTSTRTESTIPLIRPLASVQETSTSRE